MRRAGRGEGERSIGRPCLVDDRWVGRRWVLRGKTRPGCLVRVRTILFCLLVGFFFGVPAANAQQSCMSTVSSGPVIGATWTLAGSPYCISGDISVFGLTIESGVQVLVDGPFEIQVVTTINAIGTEAAPITFAARDESIPWKGLLFVDTPPGSSLAHCIIEWSDDSGLELINSSPTLEKCVFRNNRAASTGGAIYADISGGEVVIDGCEFVGNSAGGATGSGGAIYVRGDSVIRNSVIRDNKVVASRSSGTASVP